MMKEQVFFSYSDNYDPVNRYFYHEHRIVDIVILHFAINYFLNAIFKHN